MLSSKAFRSLAFKLPLQQLTSDIAFLCTHLQEINTKLEPLFPPAAHPFRTNLIAIISYDLAQKLPDRLATAFQTIICDESHALKSHTTERTRFIAPLVRAAKRALLISGTPLKSQPIELHTQVCVVSVTKLSNGWVKR